MVDEIEIKLLVPEGLDEAVLQTTLESLSNKISVSEFSLSNQYFDTPENDLRNAGIGLRIRNSKEGHELTVKTSGRSVGGMHQRPEYNIAIEGGDPDLSLFDSTIWPEKIDPKVIQPKLRRVFSTDFTRKAYLVDLDNDNQIEVVFDKGVISVKGDTAPLMELELELKNGSPEALFDVAHSISELGATQLCNLSKAARGFLLAENAEVPAIQPLTYVNLEVEDSYEQAFLKNLEYTLNYWQKAEYRYINTRKVADLTEVYTGIRITCQCVEFYNELLGSATLSRLEQQLQLKLRKWIWIDQLQSIKSLRSKRGVFSRKLQQHDALVSYLRGLQDGTLNFSRPDFLITHQDNTQLQLELSRLFFDESWQNPLRQAKDGIKQAAFKCLSKAWKRVSDNMSENQMTATKYLDQHDALRIALYYDLFFGNLFQSYKREPFRAPWLDLYQGGIELQTLKFLQTKLRDSDVEDLSKLLTWSDTKQASLLAVMEQSRKMALTMEPYW